MVTTVALPLASMLLSSVYAVYKLCLQHVCDIACDVSDKTKTQRETALSHGSTDVPPWDNCKRVYPRLRKTVRTDFGVIVCLCLTDVAAYQNHRRPGSNKHTLPPLFTIPASCWMFLLSAGRVSGPGRSHIEDFSSGLR